jgi:hypothetical protein
MTGGIFAAESALKTLAISDENQRRPHYESYRKRFEKAFGASHAAVHRAKRAFNAIPDRVLNGAAHRLAELPRAKVTMGRIVWTTLKQSPSLIWKMRSLFLK